MRAITPLGGLLAAASLCVTACGDPEFKTELNSEGPPEVTQVNVASQSSDELATFCGSGDMKVSDLFCPNDDITVSDAPPLGWYVRVIFDELLDGDAVETIDEANGTASLNGTPVTLTCAGDPVMYTGFYDPSGNHQTYPPGPALVIQVAGFAATGSDCEISVTGEVVDKQGNPVPEAQRGPYQFSIAGLAITGHEPADGQDNLDPLLPTGIMISFNAPIDPTSLDGNITLEDATGAVAVTLSVDVDDATIVIITPDAALDENAEYTVTVTSGIADVAGGELTLAEPYTFSFTTGALVVPDGGTPADADTTDAADPADAGVDA